MLVNNQKTAICFVANKAYLQHFAVCLYSFLAYHPQQHHFFLFSDDVEEADVLKLKGSLRNHTLSLVKVNPKDFETFDGFWEKHGLQVFYRFVIPQYLSEKFKFMLYLDVDMVIRGQLDFDNFIIHPFPIAAVRDTISDILSSKRGLTRYFNSGVLLIDLDFWRANDVSNALFKLKPPIKRFADQDILNEYFKDNWLELPRFFNYPACQLTFNVIGLEMENGKAPLIIHFNGGIKPWQYWQRGSLLYWHYVWKTPYRWQVLTIPRTVFASIKHKLKFK